MKNTENKNKDMDILQNAKEIRDDKNFLNDFAASRRMPGRIHGASWFNNSDLKETGNLVSFMNPAQDESKKIVREAIVKTPRVMTSEMHDIICRQINKTLFANSFIFRSICIFGYDDEGNTIDFSQKMVEGGNTEVFRRISAKYPVSIEDSKLGERVTCVKLDSEDKASRVIRIGVDPKSGRKYTYMPNILSVTLDSHLRANLKNNPAVSGIDATEDAFSTRLLVSGLIIAKTKDGLTEVRFGDQESPNPENIVEGSEELFKGLLYTTSGERKSQMLLTSIDRQEVWEMMESIGGNALSKALKNNDGKISTSKFKKLCSRYGLLGSPAVKFFNIQLKDKKFKTGVKECKYGVLVSDTSVIGQDDHDEETKKLLDKLDVLIPNNQYDGGALMTSELGAAGFRNIGVRSMTEEIAERFLIQMRTSHFYAKVCVEMVHKSVMDSYIEGIMKQIEEIEAELRKLGKLEADQHIYKIYGNPDNIGLVLDGDGAKIIQLDRDDIDNVQLYLLDVAKASKGSATSTQLYDKFIIANKKKALKVLRYLTIEDLKRYTSTTGENMTFLSKNYSVWQHLLKLAREADPKDENKKAMRLLPYQELSILRKLFTDTVTKAKAMISQSKVALESTFLRAMFDISPILTKETASILSVDKRGAIECYSADVLEAYKEEIDTIENDDSLSEDQKDAKLSKLLTACIVKYPTSGTEEIERVLFLTEKQVYNRIDKLVENGTIDEDCAAVLKRYFTYTSFGQIKIASDNAIKEKMAGFDTDYDGLTVVFEKLLVNMLLDMADKKTEEVMEKLNLKYLPNGYSLKSVVINTNPDAKKQAKIKAAAEAGKIKARNMEAELAKLAK